MHAASTSESTTELRAGGTTFHVVGTAHVSDRSAAEVREIIRRVRPEVVCVELCQARYDALTQDTAFRDLDIFKVIREGKTLYLLAHLALGAYQRRMGAALGVKPGAEMLAAIEEARAIGARVELVDRDIHTTLKRTWGNLGLWSRSKMLSQLLVGVGNESDEGVTASDIERLKEPAALSEMLAELSRALPQVKVPLIDERDQYLMSSIEDSAHGSKDVVAVVGAAHVPGMKTQFGKPVDRALLSKLPPPSLLWTVVKWLVPILLVAGFIWGWQYSDTATLGQMVLAWLVPTSVGAGLLTLLAGGHILSVLTAIFVAPIAALHPLLGTGMVVGVVEASLRRPTVKDCERLADDVQSLGGFWRNPVTRILLIAIASGLGTALGMWIGVAWVVALVSG
jgi:pheromone shutdown-related protein TraB